MKIPTLREFTSARVSLGRAGDAMPTRELLKLQLAHAQARGAVHSALRVDELALELQPSAYEVLSARSAAPDRLTYLRRPDLGRLLSEDSRRLLAEHAGRFDLVFVIADGLSANAVQIHAAPLMTALLKTLDPADWRVAPIVTVEQGRVAIGDDVGHLLGAALAVVLIGERPGLSSVDSLGIYLTWNPRPGLTDADRNCISNIRCDGLSHELAAHKLHFLVTEARRRKVSGVGLKEDAGLLE